MWASDSVSFGEWKLVRTMTLNGPTNHVQGIDFDANVLWVTSVDSTNRKGYLREFSLCIWRDDTRRRGPTGRTFSSRWRSRQMPHPFGFLSQNIARTAASIIQRRSKRTLGLEFSFNVPDHIGCIAVTPEYLVGGNWDSRDFYVWDHTGKLVRKAAADTGNAYQDMKFESGLLVASGLLPDHNGAIDWIEFPSFRLLRRLKFGSTERHAPFTREGMAIRGKQLLLLPEDEPSRVFIFTMAGTARYR